MCVYVRALVHAYMGACGCVQVQHEGGTGGKGYCVFNVLGHQHNADNSKRSEQAQQCPKHQLQAEQATESCPEVNEGQEEERVQRLAGVCVFLYV